MIILLGSEVWFFTFQVDWHTLAYSTTEGKGFSYPLMSRINFFYTSAYIAALKAAIPYWRIMGEVASPISSLDHHRESADLTALGSTSLGVAVNETKVSKRTHGSI